MIRRLLCSDDPEKTIAKRGARKAEGADHNVHQVIDP